MEMSEIFEVLKNNIVDVLADVAVEKITLDSRLIDLGANSIDRMEITVSTMEDLDVKVPIVELGKVQNIRGLVEVIHRFKAS